MSLRRISILSFVFGKGKQFCYNLIEQRDISFVDPVDLIQKHCISVPFFSEKHKIGRQAQQFTHLYQQLNRNSGPPSFQFRQI